MSNAAVVNLNQLAELNLNPSKGNGDKGSDLNDQLLANQIAAAYLALVNAYCQAQEEANKKDAKQTDAQIAKGQASAELVASFSRSQAANPGHAAAGHGEANTGASSGANLGGGGVGAAGK